MDQIISTALERFQNISNSDFNILFGGFCSRVKAEHEKVVGECYLERTRLDNVNHEFQKKLKDVIEGMKELDRSSEIGIGQYLEAKKWFKDSTERFQQEYESCETSRRTENQMIKLMKEIDRVKLDASRLLSTVRTELDLKIQSCTFLESEYRSLKNLLDELVDSIHQLNSKINLVDQTSLDIKFQELNQSVTKVEKISDDIMIHVTNLQEHQKKNIKDMLVFDPYQEKFRYLETRKNSITASGVELKVLKTIENFVRENRFNNGSLELRDIRPFIANVSDLWKNSFDREIYHQTQRVRQLSNGIEKELSLSKSIQEKLEIDLEEAERRMNDLAKNAENLKSDNERIGKELEALSDWNDTLNHELTCANEALKSQEQRNSLTSDERTAVQLEAAETRKALREAEIELKTVRKDKQQSDIRVGKLENHVNDITKKLEDANDWINILKDQLKEAEKEREDVEKDLDNYLEIDEVEELEKKLRNCIKQKVKFEVKLEESERIRLELKTQLDQSENARRQLELEAGKARRNQLPSVDDHWLQQPSVDEMMESNRQFINNSYRGFPLNGGRNLFD